MKYEDLLILVPSHGIEDFCTHLEDHDANSVLAGWCGLWHPWLIARAGGLPRWARVDEIPESPQGTVVVVPSGSQEMVDEETDARFSDGGGLIVRQPESPEEVIRSILQKEEAGRPAVATRAWDVEWVQDFYALGYSLLQVQLLTYHMRHSSHVDEETLGQLALEAATAAERNDRNTARDLLTKCFELLSKERDHYYPVDVFLLDVNLYHTGCDLTTLESDVRHGEVGNLLIGGDDLRAVGDRHPDLVAALREGVAADRLSILGGEAIWLPLELVSCESVLRQLRAGLLGYRHWLGTTPHVYARCGFGLTTTLPGILERLAFQAVWHTTLASGRLPEASQIRGPWEGCDGRTIDMVTRSPLDGGRPSTYLSFATRLGESMETDFVATVAIAHWTGSASRWHEILRRATDRGLALGRFVTFDSYRQEATDLGHIDSFSADQYRWPYLRQAVSDRQRDPISRWHRYWRWQTQLQAAEAMACWAAMIAGSTDTGSSDAAGCNSSLAHEPLADQIDRDVLVQVPPAAGETERRVARALVRAAGKLATRLIAPVAAAAPDDAESAVAAPRPEVQDRVPLPAPSRGKLLLNPWTWPARCDVELPHRDMFPEHDLAASLYHLAHRESGCHAIMDVPGSGFVALPDAQPRRDAPPNEKPLQHPIAQAPGGKQSTARHPGDFVLANEFLRAEINPKSGALRALYSNSIRGNRVSQQLAIRFPPSANNTSETWAGREPEAGYSRMEAERIQFGNDSTSSTAVGEIDVEGRLLSAEDGHVCARFHQTFRLQRGRRVLDLTIRLEPSEPVIGDPWESYYACRFAWPDPGSQLFRTLNGTRQATRLRRINSPLYVDIDDALQRTTLLVGGLPFHRRIDQRMLDSLLIVEGESARHFQLGIGVGLPSPYDEAIVQLVPPVVTDTPDALIARTGWLCHISARNVVATSWQPLCSDDPESTPGVCYGLRVRLLETLGRAAKTNIRCCRPIQHAQLVDFDGAKHAGCELTDGMVTLEMAAHEWTELEVRW